MKEFRVNDYIILKLEEEIIEEKEGLKETTTNIYVNGEKFQQCTFLLVNIPINQAISLKEIDSIDEAEGILDTSLEENNDNPFEYKIPPETEFWGHCSNIQVWAESNYNTKLLHRNLAFPLLKKLAELGDPIAKRVFKEEVAQRFLSFYLPVIHFLFFNNYLDFFSEEELELLFHKLKLHNELLFSFIKPVLMIKGYIKHNLTIEEFGVYLKKFISDSEGGKFVPLKMEKYEILDTFSNVIHNWLLENTWKKEYELLKKRYI